MKYYIAQDIGKGFITHEENEILFIKNIYGNIYQTDNEEWVNRIGAIELSEEELQYFKDEESSNSRDVLTFKISKIKNNNTKERLINWLETFDNNSCKWELI
jgi:hypothetical protein